MAFTAFYAAGTIMVAAGSTSVTGAGTLWATPVLPGDTIEAGGHVVRILDVVGNTSLTLAYGWPGAALAGASYIIAYTSPLRSTGTYVAERARELIERQRILDDGVPTYRAASAGASTPPTSPVASDLHLIGGAPTGAWAGYAGYLAVATDTGGWRFTAPEQGMRVYDAASDAVWERHTAGWVNLAPVSASMLGAANGVATLDGGGKIPTAQLPALAITDVFTVASQVAMLALTAQPGDIAIRSDLSKTFVLAAAPASTLANWFEVLAPTAAVSSVAGKTGAVTLVKGDVGLGAVDNTSDAGKPISTATQTALDGKASIGRLEGLVTDITTARTLALTDVGKAVEMDNAAANTLTVPPNSSAAFPLHTVIPVIQKGAGQTTIAAGAGVTIRSYGSKLKLAGQYAQASLYKRATDEWVLAGNLVA